MDADALVAALRADGLRITQARRAICSVLAGSGNDHLTATDLHCRAAALVSGQLDQSTVYRTLDALERLGFIHHVHLGHGPGIVHLTDHADHHHLVCEVCGHTEDVPRGELEAALATVVRARGFGSAGVHFALLGRCDRCETEHALNGVASG